jgi:hypothetical protein
MNQCKRLTPELTGARKYLTKHPSLANDNQANRAPVEFVVRGRRHCRRIEPYIQPPIINSSSMAEYQQRQVSNRDAISCATPTIKSSFKPTGIQFSTAARDKSRCGGYQIDFTKL